MCRRSTSRRVVGSRSPRSFALYDHAQHDTIVTHMSKDLGAVRSRLRLASRPSLFVVCSVVLETAVLERWWASPSRYQLSEYLPVLVAAMLAFAILTIVFARWPRGSVLVLGGALLYYWWRLILPGLPNDPRSGMAVLTLFMPWTLLAWPIFAVAVVRCWRPSTPSGRLLLTLVLAVWCAGLAFAWPYRDLARDVGLPVQPYSRIGAIAWVTVAPIPLLIAIVVTIGSLSPGLGGRSSAVPQQRVSDEVG